MPSPNFLTKTLGYFSDPKVAFVGTPQVYGNTRRSFVARGAAQQLYSFYGPLMRGLGAVGACNMIGANHIVRVAALRDIGSYAGHLTEDLLTGMRLHSHGWTSRYVPTPLAVGEGPETWAAYFNQQTRWAFGCMDILRTHSLKLVRDDVAPRGGDVPVVAAALLHRPRGRHRHRVDVAVLPHRLGPGARLAEADGRVGVAADRHAPTRGAPGCSGSIRRPHAIGA